MLQFSTYGTCPMTFDAIKLGEQWVPCDFIPHREPVIPYAGPCGLQMAQQNAADTILYIPNFMKMQHLWRGKHDVRCDGRAGIFIAKFWRTEVWLGYIEYTSGA